MCPCTERLFCCTLSFVGSTVFECEQTERNLSYHGNTRKCAEFCSKSKNHVFERRAAGLLHKHAASQKNHVFEPRIGLHGGRTFASTLVTLQICGLIIVVDVDLVTTSTSTSDDQLTLFCYCITALCTLLFSALFLSPKSSSFGRAICFSFRYKTGVLLPTYMY